MVHFRLHFLEKLFSYQVDCIISFPNQFLIFGTQHSVQHVDINIQNQLLILQHHHQTREHLIVGIVLRLIFYLRIFHIFFHQPKYQVLDVLVFDIQAYWVPEFIFELGMTESPLVFAPIIHLYLLRGLESRYNR